MHKSLVKTASQHIGAAFQKGGSPALERLGVIMTECQLVHHFQPRCLGLRPQRGGAGQAAAGENVLLDEIGVAQVALKQAVGDHDTLNTGAAPRLEQSGHGLEIGGPIFLAHGFEHFNRTDGVKWRILDVAVIL